MDATSTRTMSEITGESVINVRPPEARTARVEQPGEAQPVRIAAKDVHFYYDKFHALKGVNLEVVSHRVTALIGPSGCGKSTFLRCLNRMNDLIPNTRLEGSVT